MPLVSILEPEFDFGNVTLMAKSDPLKLTLKNDSRIKATVFLDLREKEELFSDNENGCECLFINSNDLDNSLIKSIDSLINKEEETKRIILI